VARDFRRPAAGVGDSRLAAGLALLGGLLRPDVEQDLCPGENHNGIEDNHNGKEGGQEHEDEEKEDGKEAEGLRKDCVSTSSRRPEKFRITLKRVLEDDYFTGEIYFVPLRLTKPQVHVSFARAIGSGSGWW
jgi:hypothetical protein